MKKILITGANSYIGTSFERWLAQWPDRYEIDILDMLSDAWKNRDFSVYDTIFHVAGIAHVDSSKLDDDKKKLYYKVNCELTIEVANKARKEGVKQFVFMSSCIVFGDSSRINGTKKITSETIPSPTSIYGDSKLQADIGIQKLQTDSFHVVSLRPPVIYGKDCKGNYPLLSKFARKVPVFPDIKNARSMLHVDNLCECVRLIIDDNALGYFYPQNKEYVNTSLLVKEIAHIYNKNVVLTKLFNPLLILISKRFKIIDKVFGSFVYEKKMSDYKDFKYCVYEFEASLRKTEL